MQMANDEEQRLKDRRDLGRGALAMLAGFVPRTLAGITFLFIAGNLYGAERLGQFFMATASVELLAAIAVLGQKKALHPHLQSTDPTHTNNKDIAQITWTSLALSFGIASPLTLAAYIGLSFIDDMAVMAFAIPLILICDILLTVTRHRRVMKYFIAARSVLEPWVKVLAAGAFGVLGLYSWGLAAAYLSGIGMAAFIAIFGYIKIFGKAGLIPILPKRELGVRLFKTALPTMLVELAYMASRRLDILLVGVLAGPAVAGPYGVAKEIATNVQKTQELFAPVLAPIAAQSLANRGGKILGQQLAQVSRWIFTLQSMQWLFFFIAGATILSWAGPGFESITTAFLIILMGEGLIATTAAAELPLIFTRPWVATLVQSCGLFLQLGVAALLVPSTGALGAAIGLILSAAFIATMRIAASYQLAGALCLSPAFLKPVAASLIVLMLILFAKPYTAMLTHGVEIALAAFLTLVPYAVLLKAFGISSEDRGLLRDVAQPSAAKAGLSTRRRS